MTNTQRQPNRLIHETSPYLLQHAYNPVDWYPWSEEALRSAREQDKPILLSIGYSACHWCHVMEHESFENEQIAQLMNEHFVSIKVDREERPDLDSLYMTAVQMLTGHGGWPMTVFLTPDGRPFYGGTYFPPEDRGPMPGFPRVLLAVAETYQQRRDEVEQASNQLQQHLTEHFERSLASSSLTPTLLDEAARNLARQFDRVNGGFGGAPKFPSPMALEFLLRTHRRAGSERALEMVNVTLEKMALGGIYDQVGGGFHRYAVDDIWLVPHFEKMLYDNALLSRTYTLAYQVTGNDLYARIAEETFAYVLREMTSPEGGFYSTQDADTEGEEGKFYVWTSEDIDAVLDPEEQRVITRFFGITPEGNFEGKTVLSIPESPNQVAADLGIDLEQLAYLVASGRQKLLEAREQRVHPGRDEKILTAWNGLMLRAMAEGAVVFERDDLREAAVRNAEFIQDKLYRDGRLLRSYKDGQAKLNAYLEDYANLIAALISLYEATFDPRWITWARELTDVMIAEFTDEDGAGFYDTSSTHEALIARPKDLFDAATPSGNSTAAESLLRLALLTGEVDYHRRAIAILEQWGRLAAQQPVGFGQLLNAYDLAVARTREVALVGNRDDPALQELLATVQRPYLPHKVVALQESGKDGAAEAIPLLADRVEVDGKPAAYVCENFTCQLPVTTPEDLRAQLGLEA